MSSTPPSFSFRGQELQLPASLKVSEPRQVTSALVRLSSTHFRLQSYFAVRIRNLSKYRTAHKTDLSQVGYPETNMENSPPSTATAGKAGSLCYSRQIALRRLRYPKIE